MLLVTKNNNTSPWNLIHFNEKLHSTALYDCLSKAKSKSCFQRKRKPEIIINGFYCFFFLSCNNRIILLHIKKYTYTTLSHLCCFIVKIVLFYLYTLRLYTIKRKCKFHCFLYAIVKITITLL